MRALLTLALVLGATSAALAQEVPPPPLASPTAAESEDPLAYRPPPMEDEETQRAQRRRERIDRRLGDLRGLTRSELRRRREGIVPELQASASLTTIGALGVLTGVGLMLGTLSCRESTALISFGPTCDADSGFVTAGLATASVSLVTMIVGAIWLGRLESYRKRLDLAMRPDPYAFDVQVTPNGGSLTLRGRF